MHAHTPNHIRHQREAGVQERGPGPARQHPPDGSDEHHQGEAAGGRCGRCWLRRQRGRTAQDRRCCRRGEDTEQGGVGGFWGRDKGVFVPAVCMYPLSPPPSLLCPPPGLSSNLMALSHTLPYPYGCTPDVQRFAGHPRHPRAAPPAGPPGPKDHSGRHRRREGRRRVPPDGKMDGVLVCGLHAYSHWEYTKLSTLPP